jgi:XTP/dITP diphosphohydrolase
VSPALLLASTNAHKARELQELLAPLGVELRLPAPGELPSVEEDRPSFAGNAAKKAQSAARHARAWCLADDSGLEVEALGGAPGVRSARYAGEGADAAANNAMLLRALAGLPAARRGARFVCALALARPDGSLAAEIEGQCRGRILEHPRGTGGFGYDPLFQPSEAGAGQPGRSFAELSPQEKGRLSHRGRALRELAARLPRILEEERSPRA